MEEYKIHPNNTIQDVVMPEYFRTTVMECIYLPMYFPELFKHARRFCRGFIIFGPPGVGKTYLTSNIYDVGNFPRVKEKPHLTGYRIYASDLMSKYRGDSERIVQNVFRAARENQPSLVIIEELSEINRREGESEFPRRIKTELLLQIDSVMNSSDLVWVFGVTQLPCDLPSFRRRLAKRVYVTLPDCKVRRAVIKQALGDKGHSLTERDIETLVILTQGLTCSDIVVQLREASFRPLRQIQKATHFRKVTETGEPFTTEEGNTHKYMVCEADHQDAEAFTFEKLEGDQIFVPDLSMSDILEVLQTARPCVSRKELKMYEQWAMDFTLWEPPGHKAKKKHGTLEAWCGEIICRTICSQSERFTDLQSLVHLELPLPEKLRLKLITLCAERLDLWLNERKE